MTYAVCHECHTCGTPLRMVLDGEEYCDTCHQYRRYVSHGWTRHGASTEDITPCPEEKWLFTVNDVRDVQNAYRRELNCYVGHREHDGTEYCVVLATYSRDYMLTLTPAKLARIAVY